MKLALTSWPLGVVARIASHSAWPMPCTAPPSIWLRTMVGAHDPADVVDRRIGRDGPPRRCRDRPRLADGRHSASSARRRWWCCLRRRCAPGWLLRPARTGRCRGRCRRWWKRPARYFDVGRRGFRAPSPARSFAWAMVSRGHLHRRAAGEQRARAGAAEAAGTVGVAVADADLARAARRTRRRSCARLVRCPAPSAGGHRLDDAVGQHRHRHLFRPRALPPVHSRKVAMPRPRSLPAGFGRARRASRSRPVGKRQAPGRASFELPHVVGLPIGFFVGHLLGADHVTAAQLGTVEFHLRARPRPSAARSRRSPPAGPRHGRRRSAWRWSSPR